MKQLKRIEFEGYDIMVCLTEYTDNKRPAITLVDMEDGCDYAVATINIPNMPIPNNQVVIKNYSENEGILEKLIAEGIISNPVGVVQTGYVNVPLCNLLVS